MCETLVYGYAWVRVLFMDVKVCSSPPFQLSTFLPVDIQYTLCPCRLFNPGDTQALCTLSSHETVLATQLHPYTQCPS